MKRKVLGLFLPILLCLGYAFSLPDISIRNGSNEYQWSSWLHGPPCPNIRQLELVDLDASDFDAVLKEIRLLLKTYLKQYAELGIYPGITLGVAYNQETIMAEGFGSVAVNSNEVPTSSSIYNIGSVTKIFTSLALYQSVERKQVSLTDPVTSFYNEANPPIFSVHNPYSDKGADAVTLQSLAAQTSGLPRESFCGAYPVTKQCENNTYAGEHNLQKLSQFGLLYSPFTGAHYSNFGLALLGRSLERVWNEEYENYLIDNIFQPIGMASSGFEYTSDIVNRMVTGYIPQLLPNGTYIMIPGGGYNTKSFGWSAPAGGMYSSTDDLLDFFKWIFAKNINDTVLSADALDDYLSPGILLPDGVSLYGQGTFETVYANGHWTLTKGGLTASMASSITFIPELNLGISVLINFNTGVGADQLSTQLNNLLVPALQSLLEAKQVSRSLPSNYEVFLGSYGYSSALLSMSEGESPATSGVLEGEILLLGKVYFIWDSAQDYGNYTAFRYSSSSKFKSCLTLTGAGNNALAYFHYINDKPVVTLPDQDLSFYDIPMMK